MIKSILKNLSVEEKATAAILFVLISFIFLFSSFILGCIVGSEGQKSQAIKANVAEYCLDKTTGEVKFQYIKR